MFLYKSNHIDVCIRLYEYEYAGLYRYEYPPETRHVQAGFDSL